MSPPIQAVSFDAAGTLIHLSEPVGRTYARIAAEHGIVAEATLLEEGFRTTWRITPRPFSGGDPRETEENWWKNFVWRVFRDVLPGDEFPGPDRFDPFFEDLFTHYAGAGAWKLDRDAIPLLDRLERCGIRMGVISNFDSRLRSILAGHGILDRFDPVVLSGERRRSKPDPGIFEAAVREFGCAPECILHVGDDPELDGAGAKAAGMASFLVGKRGGKLLEVMENFPLRGSHS